MRGRGRGQASGRSQMNAFGAGARFDLAGNFLLRNPGQHIRVGLRRLCAEIAVVCGQIAEILCDGLHRAKGIFEPFQRAGKGPVGNRQNLVILYHRIGVLAKVSAIHIHGAGGQIPPESVQLIVSFCVQIVVCFLFCE